MSFRADMLLPTPFSRQDAPPLAPAIVSAAQAFGATWNRPVFKAPPLEVQPPIADVLRFTAEMARLVRTER